MKIQLSVDESGRTFEATGETVLAALGELDRQVFLVSGESLSSDPVFVNDFSEIVDSLSDGKPYSSCTNQ